jgi:hypothetical protein
MKSGLAGADVVMMLRLQLERMQGAFVPSTREYFRFYGLDREKLARAAPGAKVMHPGPMNRGVEIDSDVADDPAVSLIQDQVEMGVAARMAVLTSLAARLEAANDAPSPSPSSTPAWSIRRAAMTAPAASSSPKASSPTSPRAASSASSPRPCGSSTAAARCWRPA